MNRTLSRLLPCIAAIPIALSLTISSPMIANALPNASGGHIATAQDTFASVDAVASYSCAADVVVNVDNATSADAEVQVGYDTDRDGIENFGDGYNAPPGNSTYRELQWGGPGVGADYEDQRIEVIVRVGLAIDAPVIDRLAFTPNCVADTALPDPFTTQYPVYRFWSPQNQTHFYTMDVAERDYIISHYPVGVWTYEGERFQAYLTPQPGTVPLSRFWSPRLSGHFFTSNEAEKNSVIQNYADETWTYEGDAFWVYPDETTIVSSVRVSRFWSPQNQHHFYTASLQETEIVQQYPKNIWTFEGFSYRVPSSVVLPIPPTPAQYVVPIVSPPSPVTPPPTAYYANCDAVRAAGAAPLYRGQPGYETPRLDRDGDGVACEPAW